MSSPRGKFDSIKLLRVMSFVQYFEAWTIEMWLAPLKSLMCTVQFIADRQYNYDWPKTSWMR